MSPVRWLPPRGSWRRTMLGGFVGMLMSATGSVLIATMGSDPWALTALYLATAVVMLLVILWLDRV